MKRIVLSLALFATIVSGGFVTGIARATENKNPPPPSESDRTRKNLPCETVCVEYKNGDCVRTEVRCP